MKEFDDEYKYGVYDNEELVQRFGVRDEAESYLLDLLNRLPLVENRLISDDEELSEGQLSKTMFLEKMETNIKEELRIAFEGTKFSEVNCPWLENLFRHYRRRDAIYLESSLHKYLPIHEGIIKAEDYIPLISDKIKRAVETWLKTGEITEVPDEVPKHFMQTAEQYAANMQAKMGEGKPLDGRTKSKMEGAFGSNLGEVNIHTDQQADKIAQEVDAVALTVGNDIAFAANKYKPGTPEGDGLLAHELAHTLQQKNATEPGKGTNYSSLEKDAEASTRGILSRLLGNAKSGILDWSKQIMPRMKSGLQLQRCREETIYDAAEREGITKKELDERMEADPPAPSHPEIAEAAKKISKDKSQMDSFIEFQLNGKERGEHARFFFSNNPSIVPSASTKKPTKFPKKNNFNAEWNNLSMKQKMAISDLTRTKSKKYIPDNKISLDHYDELKQAYDAWPKDKFAVFMSSQPQGEEPNNTCNIYVGEVLYKAGIRNMLNGKKNITLLRKYIMVLKVNWLNWIMFW